MDFKPGAVVRLKSGGPAMVIASKTSDGWWCRYMPDSGEPGGVVFEEHVLMLTEPDPWPRPPGPLGFHE
jgi:uncharacterized protein YodC (DUF2158 family)